MKQLTWWKRWVGGAAAVGLLGACGSVPLYGNPELPRAPRQPPVSFFEIDWWTPLVKPPLLEYAPREFASPAFDPDSRHVVALTRDGIARGLTPDGKVVWSVETGIRFNAGAHIQNGVAYVPGGNGILYAIDVRTGSVKWKYAAGESLATVPVVADGLVLVVSESDTLFAVKADDGQWAWQYRRDPPSGFTIHGACRPLVHDETAYLGFSDGYLVALKTSDGSVTWEKSLAGGGTEFLDVDTTPVLDEAGHLYVASYKGGLYALDAETGDLVWNTAVEGITSLLARGQVLFASGDGRVEAFLGENGKRIWTLKLGERAGYAPVFARGMLLVPVQRALLFVDPVTGQSRLSWNPGDGISATPYVQGSKVFVLSNNGYLYSMDIKGTHG
ncbi:PQQ-binding-like beta-propeller repeat protein [Myxococcaceae bacterium JPH2]|nr:PQQ-binding-like beta-propeller repeat protein [Myxococcaceae bacterium JPH2]